MSVDVQDVVASTEAPSKRTAERRLLAVPLDMDSLLNVFKHNPIRGEFVQFGRYSLYVRGESIPFPEDTRIAHIHHDDRYPLFRITLYLESERFPVVEDGHEVPHSYLMDTLNSIKVDQQALLGWLENQ